MAAEDKTSNEIKAPNTGLIVALVFFIAITLAASIGGSYLVGIHEGHVAVQEAVRQGRVAAAKALHAAELAQEGRSRALCNALKVLATTPEAHKLHPVFVRVYDNTQCVLVTGRE